MRRTVKEVAQAMLYAKTLEEQQSLIKDGVYDIDANGEEVKVELHIVTPEIHEDKPTMRAALDCMELANELLVLLPDYCERERKELHARIDALGELMIQRLSIPGIQS